MIKKSKLKPNIIYKRNSLILETKNNDNVILVSNSNYNIDEFVETLSHLKFLPNTVKKIGFPNFRLSLPSMRVINDTASMQSSFMELRTHKVQFNKIINPKEIPLDFQSKPIIIDVSIYRNEFNNYAIKSKRSLVSLRGMLKGVLDMMVEKSSPSKLKSTMIIHLNKEYDPFISTLIYSLNMASEFFPLYNKLNLLFITHNGFMFLPDFSKVASKGIILARLKKLSSLATNPTEDTNEIEVIAPEPDDSVEISDVVERDETDVDQSDVPNTDTNVVDNEIENDALELDTDTSIEDEETTDSDIKAVSTVDTLVDSEEEEEVVDDIADLLANSETFNDIELEFIKLAEENKIFMDKNIHKQDKALEIVQKEADLLASDKELTDLTIIDDNIISTNVKKASLMSITGSYYEKQFKKDILESLKSLNNDPEYPVVITGIEVINSSTPLSKIDTYKVKFLDKKYKQHTFSVEVPKLSHDGYLLINGNKKFISKQATPIPVIKETHDRVQITTNYRKVFLYRKGEKTSGQGDKILKLLMGSSFKSIDKTLGDSSVSNMQHDVSINYNYLAKKLFSITFNDSQNKQEIHFNQDTLAEIINTKKGFAFNKEKFIPIGFSGNGTRLILEDVVSRKIFSVMASGGEPKFVTDNLVAYLTDIIVASKDEELQEVYKRTKQSTRLSYTEVKIVSTSMTLGILIALYKGLLNALNLYNIKYRIEEKRVAKTESETILAFKDFYLYIDSEYNSEKEIFINGLIFLDTNNYLLNETFMYAPIYLDYLGKATGSKNISKALNNFEHSMIDPITLEILKELNLPTKFPELLLYGNTLLGTLSHNRKNDMANFRIRDSEVISVALYNSLMDSFNAYKRSMRTGIVQPINTKDDSVIRKIQEMPNVEDYSTLNPFLEAEVKSKTTFKGPSGLNNQL